MTSADSLPKRSAQPEADRKYAYKHERTIPCVVIRLSPRDVSQPGLLRVASEGLMPAEEAVEVEEDSLQGESQFIFMSNPGIEHNSSFLTSHSATPAAPTHSFSLDTSVGMTRSTRPDPGKLFPDHGVFGRPSRREPFRLVRKHQIVLSPLPWKAKENKQAIQVANNGLSTSRVDYNHRMNIASQMKRDASHPELNRSCPVSGLPSTTGTCSQATVPAKLNAIRNQKAALMFRQIPGRAQIAAVIRRRLLRRGFPCNSAEVTFGQGPFCS